jgi:hypothetical protein
MKNNTDKSDQEIIWDKLKYVKPTLGDFNNPAVVKNVLDYIEIQKTLIK